MRRPALLVALTLGSALGSVLGGPGCAADPPPRPNELLRKEHPLWRDGVRQKPLTADEVMTAIRRKVGLINECYARERLNTPVPAAFVFELDIPNDGTGQTVTTLDSTPKGQPILEACIADLLRAIEFPAHVGPRLKVEVPIRSADSGP